MAYQLKYYYTFKSLNETEYEVDILTSDSGTTYQPIEIQGDSTPFTTELADIDNKLTPVRGSGCVLNLLSQTDRQFFDLYTGDMQKYKVNLYRLIDSGVGGKIKEPVWFGYLDSELYKEDFNQLTNYPVQFTGNDGFNILDRITFIDNNKNKITDILTQWNVITLIFNKLGIDYNAINVALSTTVEGTSIGLNETLFHKVFVACSNYIDEDDVSMSCREVLEGILKPYGAIIYQQNAELYITDLNIINRDSADFKQFKNDFTYITTNTIRLNINDLTTLGFSSNKQQIEVVSALNKQVVCYSPYVQKSVFSSSFDDSVFKKMTATNTGTTLPATYDNATTYANYKYFRLDYNDYYNKSVNQYYTLITPYWHSPSQRRFIGHFSRIYGTGDLNSTDTDNCILTENIKLSAGYTNVDQWYYSLDRLCLAKNNNRRYIKMLTLNNLPYIIKNSDNWLKIEIDMNFITKSFLGNEDESGNYQLASGSALHMIIKIGNYYWDNWTINATETNDDIDYATHMRDYGGYWTTSAVACLTRFPAGTTDTYLSNCTQKYQSDTTINGMMIPLSNAPSGQLSIQINYHPHINDGKTYLLDKIKEIRFKNIKVSITDKYGDEVSGSDIEYTGTIDENFKNEGDKIDLIHGTNTNDIPTALGSLMYKDSNLNYQFVKSCTREGTSDLIENLLLRSVVGNYQNPSLSFTGDINLINNITGYYTYNNYIPNKKFLVIGLTNDYEEDSSEVRLIEFEKDSLSINKIN